MKNKVHPKITEPVDSPYIDTPELIRRVLKDGNITVKYIGEKTIEAVESYRGSDGYCDTRTFDCDHIFSNITELRGDYYYIMKYNGMAYHGMHIPNSESKIWKILEK